MRPEITAPTGSGPAKRRRSAVIWTVVGLTLLAFALRAWHLNSVPPGLFLDEAAYGEDVKDLLRGEFHIFFTRVLGHEPLFNYLAVPFVALWDGEPFALRLVSALMGTLMVPALFLAGRALWPERRRAGAWAGLIAAAIWAVNYWPLSVNRISFHVNTMPLIVTLSVVAWLNWSRHPTRWRALFFGFLAGLTLATYLAPRILPALWLLLYLVLPAERRRALRPTLGWALLAYALTVAPLVGYFAFHPEQIMVRVGTLGVARGAGAAIDLIRLLLDSTQQVAGVFLGGPGDPNPRHNLPGRAPFPMYLAALFLVGLLYALWRLRRREQGAWTALLWLSVMSVPAILAADANPHFLRLLGTLPAALLLMACPLARLGEWAAGRHRLLWAALATGIVLLIGFEGARSAHAYFVTWARETDLYFWYSQDVWLLGERIAGTPGGIGVVPINPNNAPDYREFTLDYAFWDTPIVQMQVHEAGIEEWLTAHLGALPGTRVLLPIWHEGWHVAADPKGILEFYLSREAALEKEEILRGFDLLTFRLDRVPQFQAPGRLGEVSAGDLAGQGRLFSSALRLTEARWGAAHPNPDRSGAAAAAGTPVWAILTWRLERPSPDLKVTLDLVDAGRRTGSVELLLLDDRRLPVSAWETGTETRTYHLLTLPPTQPPGTVELESRVYDAQTLVPLLPEAGTERQSVGIGTITVLAPLGAVP